MKNVNKRARKYVNKSKKINMKKKKITPEIVKSDILKILERRLEIYQNGPYSFEYSVEVIEEDCSCKECSGKHTTVQTYSSYLLGDELLSICKT